MKITHRKVEANKHGIQLKQPITKLMVSDPLYNKDVWCRYENNNLDLKYLYTFKMTEHIVSEEDGFEYDSSNLICVLRNDHYEDREPDEIKTFEIGVDTARYNIMSNFNVTEIETMSDGTWGNVQELWFNGEIGQVQVDLGVPDDAMSEAEFIESIYHVLNAKTPEFEVVQDEEINHSFEFGDGDQIQLSSK